MTRVVADNGVYAGVPEHLARPEQIGFFLAEYDGAADTFTLREWQPVLENGYALQAPVHVELTDETRAEVIRWATREQLSLVEIHSHGGHYTAAFSPSDRWGFDEWVPHLWWRLQGAPYAALVVSDDGTFDGWAWIDDPRAPQQIGELVVERDAQRATGETFAEIERCRQRRSRG
jgi:hypothetical protein